MEQVEEPQWIYTFVDSSRVLTIVISILLIVYGSFRALGLDTTCSGAEETGEEPHQTGTALSGLIHGFQTINTAHAVFLPVGASFSLLVMFFFFDTLQFFFALCTAVLAMVAFSFVLLPVCQFITKPCCGTSQKLYVGHCGRVSLAEVVSIICSTTLVIVWIVTGHWLLMDVLAMGLCVSMIAYIRLPSLKVSTLLLFGLLIYDVFWVFFSSYIFKANVMVKVATQQASNPVSYVANKLRMSSVGNITPQISLPGKLVFPSMQDRGRFSMLGLGDIRQGEYLNRSTEFFWVAVMPGLLLCFVMRYDNYKKQTTVSTDGEQSKISYFHCSLIGYIVGLVTATVASEVYKAAQPALLYLVPFTLLPILVMAYLKGDLRKMWQDPFVAAGAKLKFMEV